MYSLHIILIVIFFFSLTLNYLSFISKKTALQLIFCIPKIYINLKLYESISLMKWELAII